MSDKIYYTAKELQDRWGISAGTFATKKRNNDIPTVTKLHKSPLFHIDDIVEYEKSKRDQPSSNTTKG